jgi:hypothetical protein
MSQPAHNFTSDAHAEARRKFEARKATQDGYVWPVRRPEMRHGPTIRERMGEDLAAGLSGRSAAWFSIIQTLSSLGWAKDQISAHGDQAADTYRKFVRARP